MNTFAEVSLRFRQKKPSNHVSIQAWKIYILIKFGKILDEKRKKNSQNYAVFSLFPRAFLLGENIENDWKSDKWSNAFLVVHLGGYTLLNNQTIRRFWWGMKPVEFRSLVWNSIKSSWISIEFRHYHDKSLTSRCKTKTAQQLEIHLEIANISRLNHKTQPSHPWISN